MGCCISKYKPNKTHSIDECDNIVHVQDKLVISQAANRTPNIRLSKKISPSPPSSTSLSISSFTCTSNSSSLSSGSSASALSLKDRSFSNEFLWSCAKDNPHIIRINSIKEASRRLTTTQFEAPRLDSPVKSLVSTVKQSIPERIDGYSTPQKRVRSSSPTPSFRQKSFRKDPERRNSYYNLPSRGLRSPSPSRRFSGATTIEESCSKCIVGNKVNPAANPVSSSLRKENFSPASPSSNNISAGLRGCLRNRETFTHRIGSKIDEVAVAEALAHQNTDPMEDIDNPLISFDCFIFL